MPELEAAWRAGRALWTADMKADERFDPALVQGLAPAAAVFAPTLVHGEPVGALSLVWWGAGREPQAAEIRLLEGIAAQIGLAMENAELAQQTARKLRETETLLAVSRTISSTLDLDRDAARVPAPRGPLAGGRAPPASGSSTSRASGWSRFMAYHLPAGPREANRHLRLRVSDARILCGGGAHAAIGGVHRRDERPPHPGRRAPARAASHPALRAYRRQGPDGGWLRRHVARPGAGPRGQRAAADGGGGKSGGGGAGERAALPRQRAARGGALRAPRAVARGDGTAGPRGPGGHHPAAGGAGPRT